MRVLLLMGLLCLGSTDSEMNVSCSENTQVRVNHLEKENSFLKDVIKDIERKVASLEAASRDDKVVARLNHLEDVVKTSPYRSCHELWVHGANESRNYFRFD